MSRNPADEEHSADAEASPNSSEDAPEASNLGGAADGDEEDDPPIRVIDRRFWARSDSDEGDSDGSTEATGDAEDADETSRFPSYVRELEDRARQAEDKLHEYVVAYKRRQAEFDELRSQLRGDVDRRVEEGRAQFFRRLLPAVDQLHLTLEAAGEGDGGSDGFAHGVRMVLQGLLRQLQEEGLEEVSLLGKPFDPHFAEAVGIEPVEDAERDGVVVHELRKAYVLGDRCLREGQVRVGKRVAAAASEQGGES